MIKAATAHPNGVASFANSVTLVLLSRLAIVSLVPLASILVYVGGLYLEARFSQATTAIMALSTRLDAVEADQKIFVTTIAELKSQQAIANAGSQLSTAAWASWQATTNARLDKMSDMITALGITVASLDGNIKLQFKPMP